VGPDVQDKAFGVRLDARVGLGGRVAAQHPRMSLIVSPAVMRTTVSSITPKMNFFAPCFANLVEDTHFLALPRPVNRLLCQSVAWSWVDSQLTASH